MTSSNAGIDSQTSSLSLQLRAEQHLNNNNNKISRISLHLEFDGIDLTANNQGLQDLLKLSSNGTNISFNRDYSSIILQTILTAASLKKKNPHGNEDRSLLISTLSQNRSAGASTGGESNSGNSNVIVAAVDNNNNHTSKSTNHSQEELSGTISTIIKEYGGKIAGDLLECAYTAYFKPRPNNKALEFWTKAYLIRESLSNAREEDCMSIHERANQYVKYALDADFWLPLRHACLWTYAGGNPYLIFRIEYDALRDTFRSLLKDGETLTEEQQQIRTNIERIFQLSSSENDFRRCLHQKGRNECLDSCWRLYNGCSFCCLDHYNPNITLQGEEKAGNLDLSVQKWDPCITFVAIINWPYLWNANTRTIWESKQDDRQNFFHPLSQRCSTFSPFPESFTAFNQGFFGDGKIKSVANLQYNLRQVFNELITVRNVYIGHGVSQYNPENLWWCFSFVSMAVHGCFQQSKDWISAIANGSAPNTFYPTSDACKRLYESSSSLLSELSSRWNDINTQSTDNIIYDQYSHFVQSVSYFKPNETFLVLILPPLPSDFIPSTLIAAPWNLVIDLAKLGMTSSDSSCLEAFTNMLNSVEIKAKHKKLVNQEKKIRVFTNADTLYSNYFTNGYQEEIPWWQPSLEEDLFDVDGKIQESTHNDLQSFVDQIDRIVSKIMDIRCLQGRSVQLVIPMYGIFEVPCKNLTSGNWFFRQSFSIFPNKADRNFATAFFMRSIFQAFGNQADHKVACSVLYQQNSLMSSIDNKLQFFKNDDRLKLSIQPIFLPIKLLHRRYLISFMDPHDKNDFGSALCIFQAGALVPLIEWETLPTFIGDDMTKPSFRYCKTLRSSGIQLLHSRSPELSLQDLTNHSIFKPINEKLKQSARSPTIQVIALLMFHFGYEPNWALFSEETMKQDRALPMPCVILRTSLMLTLREKCKTLKDMHSSLKSRLLTIFHRPRSGATTLVRNFAWSVAFKRWGSVTLVLDHLFNTAIDLSGLFDKNLLKCLESNSHIVIIADRSILESNLQSLCKKLDSSGYEYLLIRLQHISDDSKVDDTKPVWFEGAYDTMAMDPFGQGINKSELSDDIYDIVHSQLQMIQYLYGEIGIQGSWDHIRSKQFANGTFNKLFFFELLRFCKTSYNLPLKLEDNNLHAAVISVWMHQVVESLFSKDTPQQMEKSGTVGLPSTSAVIRVLMYVAFIQLCSCNAQIDIQSLQVVLQDTRATQPLFSVWMENDFGMEHDVLQNAHISISKKHTLDPKADCFYGMTLPFVDMLIVKEPKVANKASSTWQSYEFDNNTAASPEGIATLLNKICNFAATKQQAISDVHSFQTNTKKKDNVSDSYLIFNGQHKDNHEFLAIFKELLTISTNQNSKERTQAMNDVFLNDIVVQSNENVKFISNEFAEIFLEEALKTELQRANINSSDVSKAGRLYILSMNFIHYQQQLLLADTNPNSNTNASRKTSLIRDSQLNFSWLLDRFTSEDCPFIYFGLDDAEVTSILSHVDLKLLLASHSLFSDNTKSICSLLLQKLRSSKEELQQTVQKRLNNDGASPGIKINVKDFHLLQIVYDEGVKTYLCLMSHLTSEIHKLRNTKQQTIHHMNEQEIYACFADGIRAFLLFGKEVMMTVFVRIRNKMSDESLSTLLTMVSSWLTHVGNLANLFYDGLNEYCPDNRHQLGVLLDIVDGVMTIESCLEMKCDAVSKDSDKLIEFGLLNQIEKLHDQMDIRLLVKHNSQSSSLKGISDGDQSILFKVYANLTMLFNSTIAHIRDKPLNQADMVDYCSSIRSHITYLGSILTTSNGSRNDQQSMKIDWEQLYATYRAKADADQLDTSKRLIVMLIVKCCFYEHILTKGILTHEQSLGLVVPFAIQDILKANIGGAMMKRLVRYIITFIKETIESYVCDNWIGELFDWLPLVSSELIEALNSVEFQSICPFVLKDLLAKRFEVARKTKNISSITFAMRYLTLLKCSVSPSTHANVSIINKLNGYYDNDKQIWIEGLLNIDKRKDELKHLPTYVLIHPYADTETRIIQDGSGVIVNVRQFGSFEDEKQMEGSTSNTPEYSRFHKRLLNGTVISLTFANNNYTGVVKLADSSITLPFSYEKAEYDELQSKGRAPLSSEPCVFYLLFRPWQVQAFMVQSEYIIPTTTSKHPSPKNDTLNAADTSKEDDNKKKKKKKKKKKNSGSSSIDTTAESKPTDHIKAEPTNESNNTINSSNVKTKPTESKADDKNNSKLISNVETKSSNHEKAEVTPVKDAEQASANGSLNSVVKPTAPSFATALGKKSTSPVEASGLKSTASSSSIKPVDTSAAPAKIGSSMTNEEEEEWATVPSSAKKSSKSSSIKAKPEESFCQFKWCCQYAPNCGNPHPPNEKRVFDCFSNSEERKQYKFAYCTAPDCQNGAYKCFFYHRNDGNETKKKFCTKCLQRGHLQPECTKK